MRTLADADTAWERIGNISRHDATRYELHKMHIECMRVMSLEMGLQPHQIDSLPKSTTLSLNSENFLLEIERLLPK